MDGNSVIDPRITEALGQPREKIVTKPRIEIDLAEVEDLASKGLSQAEIALNLGICEKTLYNRKAEDTEFTQAIARGRAKGTQKAADVLNKILGSQDQRVALDAAKFFLARRANWAETQKSEITGEGGGPVMLQIAKDDAAL